MIHLAAYHKLSQTLLKCYSCIQKLHEGYSFLSYEWLFHTQWTIVRSMQLLSDQANRRDRKIIKDPWECGYSSYGNFLKKTRAKYIVSMIFIFILEIVIQHPPFFYSLCVITCATSSLFQIHNLFIH